MVMATFLGTLVIVSACCLLMAVGTLAGRGPLAGGCVARKKSGKCAGCPRRREACDRDATKSGDES